MKIPHYTILSVTLCLVGSSWSFGQLNREANTTLSFPEELPSYDSLTFEARPWVGSSTVVAMATPPGETDRIFLVGREGGINVVRNLSGPPIVSEFLDIESIVNSEGGEEGLLGLAFHPEYATNRYFYVFYTAREDDISYNRLSRFRTSPSDPNVALPDSELILINQLDESPNHNGGDLHFGPQDGYLYASLGDEGRGNGQRDNTQLIDKDYFSGIIRIDVDRKAENLEPNPHPALVLDGGVARFKVPQDNPFVGATEFNGLPVDSDKVRTEFWAVGMRNPWRMSFDAPTGRLFVGDVGQDSREEINLVEAGGNYGWKFREGTIATPAVTDTPPPGFTYIDPIFEYDHDETPGPFHAVIGGVVYRGSRFLQLQGKYILADRIERVWALEEDGDGNWQDEIIANLSRIACFGVHPATGEILVGVDNTVLELVPAGAPTGTLPALLSETGAFSDLATLTPNAGIVDYEPNVTFWSDYAKKTTLVFHSRSI